MDRPCLIFVLSFCFFAVVFSEIRIKGLSATRSTLYNPSGDFTCLDGSSKIPFIYVNDDYCDCKDGSDEPGTSACPNGMFFCRNIGYRSYYIPSSRVNDAICDCCDGSDEWFTEKNCSDTCYELGASAREEAKEKHHLQQQGYQIKLQYSDQGKQTKKEKLEKLENLLREKQEAEALRVETEDAKTAAERPEKAALEKFRVQGLSEEEVRVQKQADEKRQRDNEASAAFDSLDTNQDGKVTAEEIMARPTFDQNGDGLVSEEEAKFLMSNQEELSRAEFLNTGYLLMKPYLSIEYGSYWPSTTEAPANPEELPQIPEGEPYDEDEDHADAEHDESQDEAVDTVPLDEKFAYDEETQAIVDSAKAARDAHQEAERRLRDIERDLKQIQESLGNDYGPEEEFLALHGHCFEYIDREYTYKFCPYDYASQRPKSGGSETRLGQWGHWAGPETEKYSVMMLEKGVQCWNGPQRSCKVHFSCGVDNTVTGVAEPNRCEYELHFTTPTACSAPSENPEDLLVHDEL